MLTANIDRTYILAPNEEGGALFRDFLQSAYNEAYDLLTVRKDVNAQKLTDMSSFVAHIVNYVFLLAGQSFLGVVVEGAEGWKLFWSFIALLILTLFILVYWFRIAMFMQFYLMNFIRPRNPGDPEFTGEGLIRWAAGIAVNVIFWVFVWNMSSTVSSTLRQFAQSQTPKLEEKAPDSIRSSPPHVPSCYKDQCRA